MRDECHLETRAAAGSRQREGRQRQEEGPSLTRHVVQHHVHVIVEAAQRADNLLVVLHQDPYFAANALVNQLCIGGESPWNRCEELRKVAAEGDQQRRDRAHCDAGTYLAAVTLRSPQRHPRELSWLP
jgi:hypothetical protein